MAVYDVDWSATLVSTTAAVSIGTVLVRSTAGYYYVATTANRATYGRSTGIAFTAADATNRTLQVVLTGFLPGSITGLGSGTESWVRCSATGTLERCSPSGSDDIVGYCKTDGSMQVVMGWLTATMVNAGGTPGGSDTQVQYDNAGSFGGISGFTTDGTTVTHTADPKWNKLGFVGTLQWTPTATRTITVPDATDTLVGKATSDVFTNKTFAVDATGNVLTSTSVSSGDILYHNGTKYVPLAKSTDGKVLQLSSGLPSWQTFSSGASPSGDTNSLQYKVDASTFGGSTALRVNSDGLLDVGGTGDTYPATGVLRIPYQASGPLAVIQVLDDGGNERTLLRYGQFDNWQLGHTVFNALIHAYALTHYTIGASDWTHSGLTWYASGASANTFELRSSGAVWLQGAERHKSIEKNDNYTLDSGVDYHVIVTVSGKTATLPSSVNLGDTYKISNLSGGNITVNGNGVTIYGTGGTTETLADGDTQAYCYDDGAMLGSAKWVRV